MLTIEQWQMTWTELGVRSYDEPLFHELIACYSEPHRKYHTIRHLEECFGKWPAVQAEAIHPPEVEVALWLHDAIYDVMRQDNEEKSAQWARAIILRAGLDSAVADRVYALVMATRHNAVPEETDQQILVDIDLSILGAAPERFDQYERQIREEYSWVPGFLFRRNRRKILESLLGRSRIFATHHFFDTHEALARANLERSVRQLGGS